MSRIHASILVALACIAAVGCMMTEPQSGDPRTKQERPAEPDGTKGGGGSGGGGM